MNMKFFTCSLSIPLAACLLLTHFYLFTDLLTYYLLCLVSDCLNQTLETIFQLFPSNQFSWNIAQLYSGIYIHLGTSRGKSINLLILNEIPYLTNRICSDIIHKFIVDDNGIFMYCQRRSGLQGHKYSFIHSIEVAYLTNRFFSILQTNSFLIIV